MKLLFDDYAPDLDPTTAGACQDMAGWAPSVKGFRTLPAISRISMPLSGPAFGMFSLPLLGTNQVIGATANQIYLLNQTGIVPEPWISQALNLANTQNRWCAASYGAIAILVDGVDAPQYYQQGVTATFAPLPGNPPIASLVETTDYATILVPPNSQQLWSNLSPTAPWVPNIATEVYQYNLAQIPGNITAVARSRSLLAVYRENALQCATFVGGSIGWDFGYPGTISRTIGVASNGCVINTGDYHYILGPDDFWQFDGYNLTRIPNNLKEWFFRDLDQDYVRNVAGRYDIQRNLVFWHYPSTRHEDTGILDSYVVLNLRTGKWGFGRKVIELPMTAPAPDPQTLVTTPDSGIVLPDHSLYFYDDRSPFDAVSGCYITSNDFGDRRQVFQTTRVRAGWALYPTGNPTPAKCTALLQQQLTGVPPTVGPTQAISNDGWFNIMASARLTRYQINVYGPAELTAGDAQIFPTGEI